MGAHEEKQSCKNNGRKFGSPHQGPRAGQAVRDSHLEGTGSTHSQLLLDHTGCGCNGAGRVMLHHLGELCQVPLHELQGFRGLWEDREGWQSWLAPPPFVPIPCASSVPDRHIENSSDTGSLGSEKMLTCPNSMTWYLTKERRNFLLLWEQGLTLTSYVAMSNSHLVLGCLL